MFLPLTSKSNLSPEQRVKITCELSNTALAIFLSSLKNRFSSLDSPECIAHLKKLVRARERIRRP